MALNANNVGVARTGLVWVGPTTATAPTSGTSALTGFTDLGYVGEDGITETTDRSVETIRAWQNGAEVRKVVTEGSLTYTLRLLETTVDVIETALGVEVTQSATEGTYVIVPTQTGGRKSFVFDIVDGAETKRIYVASGEVTELGEIVYANGEAIGYEVTISTYETATLGGNAKVFDTRLKTV